MAIPESQMETWSKQGAIVTAKTTHESIRNALKSEHSPISDRVNNGSVEIYLQGSYKSDTNIRGDSDVDVVVELNTTFGHDAHKLPADQKNLHDILYDSATYGWNQFRADVVTALTRYYGNEKIDATGNKSVKLLPTTGRLKADIVPVIKFRKYTYFHGLENYHANRGIKFYHRKTGQAIVNFPHHHYSNGVTKNSENRTNGWYKPSIRIFKNMRGYIPEDLTPSYFLECMLYNVPDSNFGTSYQETFCHIVNWLDKTDLDNFDCQNGQLKLFGMIPEQWNTHQAKEFINNLISLWNNW